MTAAASPRELARLRQQRRRDRVREGRRCIRVEVDEALIEDALICGGLLLAADADDQKKVAAALAAAIHAWSEEQIAAALVREIRHA